MPGRKMDRSPTATEIATGFGDHIDLTTCSQWGSRDSDELHYAFKAAYDLITGHKEEVDFNFDNYDSRRIDQEANLGSSLVILRANYYLGRSSNADYAAVQTKRNRVRRLILPIAFGNDIGDTWEIDVVCEAQERHEWAATRGVWDSFQQRGQIKYGAVLLRELQTPALKQAYGVGIEVLKHLAPLEPRPS